MAVRRKQRLWNYRKILSLAALTEELCGFLPSAEGDGQHRTAKMIRGEREEQWGDACSGGVNMVLEVWHPFGLCEHGCGVVQNSNVVLALI